MSMIKCNVCNKKINDDVEKCPECGVTIDKEEIARKKKKNEYEAIVYVSFFVPIAGAILVNNKNKDLSDAALTGLKAAGFVLFFLACAAVGIIFYTITGANGN